MRDKLAPLGTLAGALGTIICILALIGRSYGSPKVVGLEASSFFLIGVGVLVWACWIKLEARSGSTGSAESAGSGD